MNFSRLRKIGSCRITRNVVVNPTQDWIIRSIFTFLILFPMLVLTKANAQSQATGFDFSFPELEKKVWTANSSDLPEVEQKIVKLVQIAPYSPEAYYLLSRVLYRLYAENPADLRLLKQASELAEQAIDLDPMNEVGYIALADILDLMGQTQKAILLLEQAEKSGLKLSWRASFTRARLLADGADNMQVLALLEKSLKEENAEPDILVPYVIAVLQTSLSGDSLIEELTKWQRKYPNRYFVESLATVYAQNAYYQKAHERYKELIAKYPESEEAAINDAVVLYRHLKKPEKAKRLMQSVLSKKALNVSTKSIVHAHLGAISLELKKFEEAHKHFLKSLIALPDNLSMVDLMTKAYKKAKAFKNFVKLIETINNEMRGQGVLYALQGETYSEDLGNHRNAIEAFENAIILEPTRSDFRNGLGLVYYRMKQYEDALKSFSDASSLDPSDSIAHYNKACILSLLGKDLEAILALQEAVALDPSLKKTAKKDEDFASLWQDTRFQKVVMPESEENIAPQIFPEEEDLEFTPVVH